MALIHEKVQIWIYSKEGPSAISEDRRILLLQLRPERGSFWQPVTGGVDPGETLESAALREAREETALQPFDRIHELGFDFTYEGRWGKAHETVFFFETVAELPTPKLDPSEHSDFRWVSAWEAMKELKFPTYQEALHRLLQKWDNPRS